MAWHWWLAVAGAIAAAAALGTILWRAARKVFWEPRLAEASRHFHLHRERLEAKFIKLLMGRSRPSAPRGIDCRFEDEVAYARNRVTGELSAFVGVSIEFEDGSLGLEGESEPGGNIRLGTAVFRFDGQRWDTDGRVIYNLTPREAIHFYKSDLKPLTEEPARRS